MSRRRPAAKTKRKYSAEARQARAARMKTRTDADRFWEKVEIPELGDEGACWLWTSGTNKDGYGVFHIGSAVDGTRRKVLAHRFAYELENGPLPDGVVLLHGCDTPACVRHTAAGTQAENMADMIAKGRHSPPPVRRGPRGIVALLESVPTSPRATARLREVNPRLVGVA